MGSCCGQERLHRGGSGGGSAAQRSLTCLCVGWTDLEIDRKRMRPLLQLHGGGAASDAVTDRATDNDTVLWYAQRAAGGTMYHS